MACRGVAALSPNYLLFLLFFIPITNAVLIAPIHGAAEGPLERERRVLSGSFQVCAVCTCCGGPKRLCLPSPCCYAIKCNIPNRPFGFCSFTPRACNCFGCHL